MITRDQLEAAYSRDPSSVERLAWFLDLNTIGEECIDAVDRKLWELAFCSAEARLRAEREARA